MTRGAEVLRAMAFQPGGRQLQRLGRERGDVALVGGAVRDLLRGQAPRELDVVLAGDAASLARELALALAASVTLHGRFGTAVVEWEQGRIDVAERRAESYAAPGALPDVREGSVEEDLRRRDFTVNAIAVPLSGPELGQLLCAEHALEDLEAGRLRVLHERSFVDDPTRVLRLARYSARLGFTPERHTAELAAQALAAGALATVSRARIGAELRLALGEADAPAALRELSELGVLSAIDAGLAFDERLARAALALLGDDGRGEVLLMASLLLAGSGQSGEAHDEQAMFELLDGLELTAAERDGVMRSVLAARGLARGLADAVKPSELRELVAGQPLEAIALAGAWGGEDRAQAGAQAAQWLRRLRHVRLVINGDDLLAAGVPAGPELGRRLDAALARKLDGELAEGTLAELNAALEASV
jgi:tRNA nucleotidyltransferase (CCA-adding enzyme)